jgi:hypothetical protein
MAFYGTSPGEGGTHILGWPSFPGMAWSEGWATWFSSDMRQDPVYYDKQQGTFFWLNIASRAYADGRKWYRPSPSKGLIQLLDENDVSAMLWSISNSATNANQSLYTALASTLMNTSPFKRGYTRHLWTLTGTGYANVVDTKQSVPMLADFLDALDCAGFSRSTIDSATQPATYYPYPSGAPLCP